MEIRQIEPRERTAAAPDPGSLNQSTSRIRGLLVLSPIHFHPFCNLPQRVRSRATSRMIESRNNRRSSSASRRSPSSITTLPAARAPADTLLRLYSAASRKTEIPRFGRNVQADVRYFFGADSPLSTGEFIFCAGSGSPSKSRSRGSVPPSRMSR